MAAAFPDFVPQGVIPAALLPFRDDLSIDAAGYRSHLRDLAGVRGIAAITTNAHASEVASCDPEEQRRVLALTMEEVGARVPVVAGVYADGTHQAVRLAKAAAAGGASALLVFPTNVLARGNAARPDCAADHVRHVAATTDLPLILIQYPLASGLTYPLPILLELAEEVPTFRAIKDWSGDPALAERQVVALQGLPRPVNVLARTAPGSSPPSSPARRGCSPAPAASSPSSRWRCSRRCGGATSRRRRRRTPASARRPRPSTPSPSSTCTTA